MHCKKLLSAALSAAMIVSFNAPSIALADNAAADQTPDATQASQQQQQPGEEAGSGATAAVYKVLDANAHTVQYAECKATGKKASVPASVTLTDGQTYNVVEVGEGAFRADSSLQSVTIANGVTAIGERAFEECVNLTSVTLPASVESVSDNAFFYCTRLQSVKLPAGLKTVGKGAFYGCHKLKTIDIPSGVQRIDKYAFGNCTKLTTVTGMQGVQEIAARAFKGCSQLETVELGNSLTTIGDRAFMCCTFLANITLPQSLQTLGEYAFASCGNLDSVSLGVKVIPKGAFRASRINNLTLLDGVESIETSAFDAVDGPKTLSLPKTVTSISEDSALTISTLEALEVAPDNPCYSSIDGVLYNKDASVLVNYPMQRQNESFAAPVSVTQVGNRAFKSQYLLTSVDLSGVTKIGDYAFSDATSLEKITFSSGLASIGEHAFEATALKSVALPETVKSIPDSAFELCGRLKKISIPGAQSIGHNAFTECKVKSFAIPACTTSVAADFCASTECKSYRVDAGSTSFKAIDGVLFSADGKTLVSCPSAKKTKGKKTLSYSIPQGTQVIGAGAFERTSIAQVNIPSSVTTIEDGAFQICPKLVKKGITIPATVTSIGNKAVGYGSDTYDKDEALKGTLVIGERGSAAEQYALDNDFAFATGTPKMKIAKAKLAKKGKKTTVSVAGMKTGQVKFYSSDENVVKVNAKGKVTAVGKGKTNIVAAMGSYYMHVDVQVTGGKASKGNYSSYKKLTNKKALKAWEKKYYAANRSCSYSSASNPAINCYTGDEYKPIKVAEGDEHYKQDVIQDYGDDIEEYAEISDCLDLELKRFKLPASTLLGSGAGNASSYTAAGSALDDLEASVGKEVSHGVLVSTSLFDDISVGFAGDGAQSVHLQFYAPKNKTVCGYLYKFSEYPGEYEVLLSCKSRYKIVDCGVKYVKTYRENGAMGKKQYVRYLTLEYLGA